MSRLQVTEHPRVSAPVRTPRRARVPCLGRGRAPVCTHGGRGPHQQQHEVSVAWKLKAGTPAARSRQAPSGPAPSAPPASSRRGSAAERQPQARGGGRGEQSPPAPAGPAPALLALHLPPGTLEVASGRLSLPDLQHQGATSPTPDSSWKPLPHPFFPESSVFNLAGEHPGPRLRTPAVLSLLLLPPGPGCSNGLIDGSSVSLLPCLTGRIF